MSPMQRRGLARLLLLGATVLAATMAQAKPRLGIWGPVELANVGDEPGASGEATLTDVVLVDSYTGSGWYSESYTGTLTVACKGLTPGAKSGLVVCNT